MSTAALEPRQPDRPHLLLIASGEQVLYEYLLRSIAGQYRVHLILAGVPCWQSRYLDGYTVVSDTTDAGQLLAAARSLDAQDRLHGVLCWDEASVIAAAQVSDALGLPGAGPDMVLRCQDKQRTRLLLHAAGVPQPESILVEAVEQAVEAAAGDRLPGGAEAARSGGQDGRGAGGQRGRAARAVCPGR